MAKFIDGMEVYPLAELKSRLLGLPNIDSPVPLNSGMTITSHKAFIESNIRTLELNPTKPKMDEKEQKKRLLLFPIYYRLLIYYNFRIKLIEA